MKKPIGPVIVICIVIAGIAMIHYARKSQQSFVSSDITAGDTVTFELKYRGISGKKDDLRAYGGYGFGGRDAVDSTFINAVTKQAENSIFISQNPYLSDRQYTAVEYKGQKAIAVYFDLNGDGQFSKNERLLPTDVSRENRRGDDTVVFLTPDFTVTGRDGQKAPFRVILWVNFYQEALVPSVTWWPMGVYEGTVKIGKEKMRFYLFPDFYQASYTTFGSSDYAIVPTSYESDGYVPRHSLSSLIVHDKTFYRMAVKTYDDNQKISVILTEDKSPRGKIAFKVHGQEGFNYAVNNATLRSPEDKMICFSINRDIDELPVGDYAISSGYINYGQEKAEGYSTSFSSIPAFAIKASETTTVQFGKPKAVIRAVELNKRYNSDKEYKTEFSEDTPIYLDVLFSGMAKETYRGFQQRIQRENYTTQEYIKAQMTIVDAQGNTVVSEELEPG